MARIAVHLHQLSLGGAERITVMWCQWLVEMGHQVQLFIGQPDERAFFSPPASVQILRRPAGLPALSGCVGCCVRTHPICASVSRPVHPSIFCWPVLVALGPLLWQSAIIHRRAHSH